MVINVGDRFGRLMVESFDKKNYRGVRYWNCICDCGARKSVSDVNLYYGGTKSCGCYRKEIIKTISRIHGLSKTKEYNAWYHMIRRCYYPENNIYHQYGARGIRVCDRWLNSFENFLSDMGNAPTKFHSLDRKNNDANYEPANCKWSTDEEQRNNKQQTVWVILNGERVTMKQWSIANRLPYKRVHALHRYKGLSFDQILDYYSSKSKP